MLLNPDALVHAEIERRLELAGARQRYQPLRVVRTRPTLRELLGRRHRTPGTAPRPTTDRRRLPLPPAVAS